MTKDTRKRSRRGLGRSHQPTTNTLASDGDNSSSSSCTSSSSASTTAAISSSSVVVGKKRSLLDFDGDGVDEQRKKTIRNDDEQHQNHQHQHGDADSIPPPSSPSSSSSSLIEPDPSEPLRKFGLQSLVQHYLGLSLAKPRSVRLSNWEVVELTDAQVQGPASATITQKQTHTHAHINTAAIYTYISTPSYIK